MAVTESHFRAILGELVEENPIACRGVLSILDIVFTEEVPTLAVSLSDKPRLLVNLKFVAENTRTEAEVKSLLLHEFLHVLLNHTEQYAVMNRATNVALDSVINAIIHRTFGAEYSAFMFRYYGNVQGFDVILRPMRAREARRSISARSGSLYSLWAGIYNGRLVVDDIVSVAAELSSSSVAGGPSGSEGRDGSETAPGKFSIEEASGSEGRDGSEIAPGKFLIGDHRPGRAEPVSERVRKALDETMEAMNGHGIWRSPKGRGIGANPYEALVSATDEPMRKWEIAAWRALRDCTTPDRRSSLTEATEIPSSLPVLTAGDRRSFLRSLWCPFIPDSQWKSETRTPRGTTQVYLDVSGSMESEMQAIVSLLDRLRCYIRMPFWAFSDEVGPAVIENGVLITSTTGGTSINSVLKHIAETKPGKAVIITDGYVEPCSAALLRDVRDQKVTAIVSRDGSGAELERAGIPYVQLERFPS